MRIYLDNAAGSYPKPEKVALSMEKALHEYGANPGRGSYEMARHTDAFVAGARERLAGFFHVKDPNRIIFTAGATHSLNMAIFGSMSVNAGTVSTAVAGSRQPKKRIMLGGMEHNAVSRPAYALSQQGSTELVCVRGTPYGEFDGEAIILALRERPDLTVITAGSNVTGSIAPMEEINTMARKMRVPLVVDAAQTAGLLPVWGDGAGATAIAPHKALYGPSGIGLLLTDGRMKIAPLIHGGTGMRSEEPVQPDIYPQKLEAGSLNVCGIAGLLAGLDMVEDIGIETLHGKTMALTAYLAEMLGNIRGVELYLPDKPCWEKRLPVLAANIDRMEPALVAAVLDKKFGICVRAGYHCAPHAQAAIGTQNRGCLRFSPGWYNTREEMEYTASALRLIAANKA